MKKENPNMEEKMTFGQLLCNRMTNAFGEWAGFEIPEEMKLNKNSKLQKAVTTVYCKKGPKDT